MARKVVRLNQHTPMLHFQHNQKGACLRASELKPKLDKFLLSLSSSGDFEKFKIEGTDALDYKLRVKPGNKRDLAKIGDAAYSCYFGNIGDNENKEFVKYDWIDLDFFSYYDTLIEKIVRELPEFLQLNNFGTRQSKGFGSFYIAEDFVGNKELYSKSDLNFDNSWRYFDLECDEDEKELFTLIELFYKTLRSGINLKDRLYFKPFIETYAYSKGIQWEKKTIKDQLINNVKDKSKIEKKIVKDIMGLSVSEKWGSAGMIRKESTASNENKMERFKSPIIFKPIKINNKFRVYFKAASISKISEKFWNHEFLIKKGSDSIKLETISDFNFEEFFNFAFETDLADYIKKHSKENTDKYLKSREFTKINKIYTQLKGQRKGE